MHVNMYVRTSNVSAIEYTETTYSYVITQSFGRSSSLTATTPKMWTFWTFETDVETVICVFMETMCMRYYQMGDVTVVNERGTVHQGQKDGKMAKWM